MVATCSPRQISTLSKPLAVSFEASQLVTLMHNNDSIKGRLLCFREDIGLFSIYDSLERACNNSCVIFEAETYSNIFSCWCWSKSAYPWRTPRVAPHPPHLLRISSPINKWELPQAPCTHSPEKMRKDSINNNMALVTQECIVSDWLMSWFAVTWSLLAADMDLMIRTFELTWICSEHSSAPFDEPSHRGSPTQVSKQQNFLPVY